MDLKQLRKNIPVIVLYNLNPTWSEQDQQECLASMHELSSSLKFVGHSVHEVCLQSAELEALLTDYNPDKYVILNWCEELPGLPLSEHKVAQKLEQLGFTFTGSDSRTLAIGQDKCWVKRILQRHQIQIPDWKVYSSPRRIKRSQFPAIVKLAYEHCSYGITRESVVQSNEELQQRVYYVINELHQPALVEEFIDGREFHVSIIGNDLITILPPAEIDYSAFKDIHDRLCTYEANFNKTSLAYKLTQPKLPAILTQKQADAIKKIAIAAYRAVNCRDYARMDIRMRGDTFYLLDVNPNPDISSDTSLALGAELIGLSYGKLISRLIHLALRRHPLYDTRIRVNIPGENRCLEL
jgi:D-alanine-D-alanine ligase